MADVALVPERHVIQSNERVGLHDAREAANALDCDGIAFVRHRRRALLTLLERLFRLDDIGLLQQTHLHRNSLERRSHRGQRRHDLRMAIACDNLR